MTLHIILLVIAVILLIVASYLFGMRRERMALKREANKIIDGDTKEHLTSYLNLRDALFDPDGGATLCVWIGIMIAIWFIGSYSELREKWINQYRNGEIVENVKYHYQKIDGKNILKDSTFYYTKIRD